jgi:hypothetical protein
LYLIFTVISLLIIELNICPNIFITIAYLNISLTHLLTIVLIINLVKLFFKWINAIISMYNNYLHKDFFIIYTNVYFSVIIIILYLGDFNNVYPLYL